MGLLDGQRGAIAHVGARGRCRKGSAQKASEAQRSHSHAAAAEELAPRQRQMLQFERAMVTHIRSIRRANGKQDSARTTSAHLLLLLLQIGQEGLLSIVKLVLNLGHLHGITLV